MHPVQLLLGRFCLQWLPSGPGRIRVEPRCDERNGTFPSDDPGLARGGLNHSLESGAQHGWLLKDIGPRFVEKYQFPGAGQKVERSDIGRVGKKPGQIAKDYSDASVNFVAL